MSRSELERLVSAAEADERLRRLFRRCHNSAELVSTARILGYRITEADLRVARVNHAVERRRRMRPMPPRPQSQAC